ncbi:hypothetical protein M231_01301 [Tremella mesenterica]|uniref:NADP-dependent oxidoreductase domain-containing protein n=1 Tax=Tremella mesenterica TaxID=5217 RepID=A0A4Q1BTP2_TREME|nr:hypothetical protein M231_01301 [Tremella mesenterica]
MSIPTKRLNDGTSIPVVGYGIGTVNYRKECTEQIVSALKTGYRYLDAAEMYGNSASIKDALEEWGGKREDVYILTKFGADDGTNDPRGVLTSQLKDMGLDYVDMYLIHSPFVTNGRTLGETWKLMEELQKEGLTKSIGVSNYRPGDIKEMESSWTIPPATNQIEYHPYVAHEPRMKVLKEICDKHKITIMAYGGLAPLTRGTGPPLEDVVNGIASETSLTPGQVLLKWAFQFSGGVSVTTSTNSQRQKEQLEAFILPPLTEEQVQTIAKAGEGRVFRHFMRPVWDAAA